MRRFSDLGSDRPYDELDLCRFCYLAPNEEVLFENENVYVLPSVGCFVEGYCLLLHQEHKECFAEAADPSIRAAKYRTRQTIEAIYGNCVFYEHGRTGNCFTRGNCKIEFHAHIHCVPVDVDISETLAQDFQQIVLDDWTEIRDFAQNHPEYLYFETDDRRKYFYPVNQNIERQYLRKRICEAVGMSDKYANWREYPFEEKMDRTAQKLKGAF